MRVSRMSFVSLGLSFAAGLAIASQPPAPAPSLPPVAPAPTGIEAMISEAAFLAGDWKAKRTNERGAEEFTQEVWTAPAGNNMLGMFRWVGTTGKPIVFEILTIVEERGSLVLRLRHQTASGVAWEEKEKPASFALAAKTATRLDFVDSGETCDLSACIYECPTPDTLVITVKFDNEANPDLVFTLTKTK